MRTILVSLAVSDLDLSMAFYAAVGYLEVGRVVDESGAMVMLRLPEESAVSLELVHRPSAGPVLVGGFDHLAIATDDLTGTHTRLTQRGLAPSAVNLPTGPDGPQTSWLIDPDGYRIELVQWPPGHQDRMTQVDFDHE